MKVELKLSGRRVASVDALFDLYGPLEFHSPRRSTVPNLAFWLTPSARIQRLCDALGWTAPASCQIDFEHQVSPFAGEGKPSHTDLMISWRGSAVGVEAKFTEGRYRTVREWLGEALTVNRRDVLNGWVEKIASVTGHSPTPAELDSMTYQALHRVASVCDKEAERRAVLYLVFSYEETGDGYYDDLLFRIRHGFRTDPHLRMGVVSVQVVPSDGYRSLIDEWTRTKQCDKTRLRTLLLSGQLMMFNNVRFRLVGEGEKANSGEAAGLEQCCC